ncbi:alpha/beta fold hydrolase [Ligilactobacillus acidipiscis]|uniref:alpha/beta fold hydrolase n=1 Tax=Ligilactobacillus acidipiscis TaxID=89059 RepID=UPI0023F75E42|nr:alpha/beta fold hydrolase [Ligilactobacillus acidipiscis]WEV55904.1 alpha/beta fold hydrolase [Ligilactobacillus acidipiscis]
MISVSEKQVASLPVLEVVDAVSTNEKLPLIVFYHGWTNCKEVVLTQGYELAKRGFRVILPEALYHGVRAEGKVTDHFLSFWEVPLKSVQEFTQLINYYREHDLILNDQIGVGGFSMGGITTCMLMAANDEIKAGVVLSGTPHPVEFCQQILSALPSDVEISPAYKKNQLKLLTKYDLSLHPEKIMQRPLHFWHGDADEKVPCDLTENFGKSVKDIPAAQNVSIHISHGAKHKLSYDVTQEMVQKFINYLQ